MSIIYKMKSKILFNYQPVGIWNRKLVLYKAGDLFLYDPALDSMLNYGTISSSIKETFLSYSSLITRALRLRVRSSIIDEFNRIHLYVDNELVEFCLNEKKVLGRTKVKSRPLYIAEIKGIKGFTDSLVFGEYCVNPKKESVNIYSRCEAGIWNSVYTFPEGLVNHIHNIIPDKYKGCVWILTGDFDNSAAIWKAEDNFRKVTPVLFGQQEYRGCIGFPSENGLLYATDTPFKQNSIRLLKKNSNGEYNSQWIQDINGSCIYGCKYNGLIYFATTVESNGIEKNILKFLFSRKRGDGIKNNKSYLYKEVDDKFNVIYSSEKDFLPFVLFQFGSLKFPATEFNYDYLPIYHVASKKYNMSTLLMKV